MANTGTIKERLDVSSFTFAEAVRPCKRDETVAYLQAAWSKE
jgi:hypothetical protein